MNSAVRKILAILAVFITWQIMDFIIHAVCLGEIYGETKAMWRPEGEMKMGLMALVSLVASAAFVLIYGMISPKSLKTGLIFGLLFGIGTGIGMGFGSYSVQPFPIVLAWGWMLGTIAETVVAGLIVASILKD